MRKCMLSCILAFAVAHVTFSKSIITGVGTTAEWDSHLYNAVAQWRVTGEGDTTDVEYLGRVRLGPNSKVAAEGDGLLGYDCETRDVAILKDGRIAVLHDNEAKNAMQVTLLRMLYDEDGLLVGADLLETMDVAIARTTYAMSVIPTGDGGFALMRNGGVNLEFYAPDEDTFTLAGTVIAGDYRDGAGTISPQPQVAYQVHGAVNSYRTGYDDGSYKVLARYTDLKGTTANHQNMDGLRHPLTPNGWVIQSMGNGIAVCDDSTVDGSDTTCILGYFYESDGTTPFGGSSYSIDMVAGLSDGRVVAIRDEYGNTRSDFYVFDLTTEGLPLGESVGAVGYQHVRHSGTIGMGVYGVRFCGDYQIDPDVTRPTLIILR